MISKPLRQSAIGVDPFGVTEDPAMFFLRPALDAAYVEPRLQRLLQDSAGKGARVRIRSIRVVRHKPGRRCLIEYGVRIERSTAEPEDTVLLGKVRASKVDLFSYQVQRKLWENGFASDSPDGISVPEPVGVIPGLRMWLQRQVPGVSPVPLLVGSGGGSLATRVAEAAHKLHRTSAVPERRHGIEDEIQILRERLGTLAEARPKLADRLHRVLRSCERLGASLPDPCACGIHRDFYPDQLLVDGDRIFLLDFDLFCAGDPALDIGNFIGHLIEDSLRRYGNADALAIRQQQIEEHFASRYGRSGLIAIRTYTTLTLARHISISTQFSSRRPFTDAILELCEERLLASTLTPP